ncbi:MAG: type II toxin-antitoxin system HicB family antitoxin [Deltaproteobacteria bacterium]|nr:type II toxin-antitoxin system HicB family antitoxin [Deltaproteobacteria bacterium]
MKKIPYMIRTFWSEEDACYVAEVPELKGCSGLGETPEKSVKEAERSIDNWLRVAKKEGVSIPPPIGAKHSKRINLRLPEEIIDGLKRSARERSMSLNQYLLWRLAT